MAKYYMDENGNWAVKKEEDQKKKRPKYTIDEKGNVTVNNTGDDDIAPVRTDISTKQQTANTDYLVQAQKGLAAYNQKKAEAQEKENNKKWWQKLLEANASAYLAANDNPFVMSMNQQAQIYRQDTSYKEPNDKWSEDQKNQFGYLYMMDPAYASQYAEAINNQINKDAAEAQRTQIKQDAGDSKLKSTASALLKGATSTADFLDNIAEFSGRGTITQKADLSLFEQSQAEIEGVSESLNELGTISEDVAVIGGKGLGDLYGLGISAAQSMIYGATGNGALTMIQFFGQAAASGVDEKMGQGATAEQAMLYGIAAGTAEAVAEKIGIDNLFKNSGAKTFRNFLGNMLKQGVSEGLEEAITSVLNTFSDQVIMGKESQYNQAVAEYSKTMSQEEAKKKALGDIMEGIAYDALGGFITGSGNTAVMTGTRAVQNVSNGKGALSGLTANEQKVIDKVYKDLVAEEAEKAKDGKVSQAKKNELYDQAVAAMDKGYIATDTIEEVLGGDDFKAYQMAQDKENAVLKELEDLYQGEELAAQQQGIRDNSTLSQLRQTMGDKVAELVKGDRLAESYREKGRRSQLFQADVSQYDEKQRTIVQKAIDSGVLNNTNRSHELVDLIAKVCSDKDLDFDFINNEKLKESGFALNGKTVNGFLSDSGVTVNINSAKALNSVVGHEITHVLEGTEEFYTALESMVTEYAKSKGEYNARLTELRSLYADVDSYKGADGHEKIKKELVADLVGDYIFTDSEFVSRLSVENRNLFEKIYDELKYLCRVATAGSKELRQLEKAKKAFEDAYRQDAKNTADDGGVRYSIARTGNMSWDEQVKGALYDANNIRRNDTLVVTDVADTRVANEINNKPLAIPQSVLTKAQSGKDISHSIKKGKLAKLDEGIKNAPITIVNPERNAVVFVTNIKQGGLPIVAAFDMNAVFDGDEVHKATSIHLQVDTDAMLKNLPETATVYVKENELDPVGATNNLRGLAAKIKFIGESIAQNDSKVNSKFSLSSQEDMFPVRKDLDAVRGKIYGRDVELQELGPVRKDIQTEEAAQDPYDDLPFDMPENLEEGQLSDAELEEDARRNPVTTVAERLEVKFASLRQELQTNEQNRKASAEAYDQRIAELQQRYDAKPKKHTKAANAILRQIAKQKQLKAERDAEFEKRINDIKKKIDKTRGQMQMDHTREDLLEKQLRQVDEKLEADKQALEEEFRERRAEAERVADRASYFSSEARILRDEILYHKKGTGFSEDIRELLGHGHSFKEIKDALRTVEQNPEGMKDPNWLAEQNVRKILEGKYENAVYDADKVEADYQRRLKTLNDDAEAMRSAVKKAAESTSWKATRTRMARRSAEVKRRK